MKALSSGRHGLALVLMLMAAFALSATPRAEMISIEQNAGTAGLTIQTQEQTGIELRYEMAQFSIEDFDIHGQTLQKIGLPGCFLPGAAGAPDLPGFGRYLAIPAGAEVSVTVLGAETHVYSDLDVMPAAAIQFENDDSPPTYEKDPAIYGTRAHYPAMPVKVSEPITMRGVEAVTLGITPFQYNPVTRELTVYTAIDIRVDFAGGGQWADERLRNRYWESMLKDQLLNYDMLPAADFFSEPPTDNRTGCEYVILTAENATCLAWADSIRTWRQAEGISTEIFTTAQTGTSAYQIDQWLANAYNTWDVPPVAFLILGDYPNSGDFGGEEGGEGTRDETLPGVYSQIYAGYCVADNIYADATNDHLPDMAHGRICAKTDVQMQDMIEKMFSYEREPVMNPGYYDHPLIAGGWQTERWFILCSEIIYGHQANALGKDPVREYAIYSGSPGYTWSTAPNTGTVVGYFGPSGLGYIPAQPTHLTDWGGNYVGINNAINDGAYFVMHRDHGFEVGWGEPAYNSGNANMLTNADNYPFVFSINCLTGKYNWNGSSFTENFHRFADKGAVGLIAASEVSYSFVNDVFVWGIFDSMWPEFDPYHGDGGTPATLLRPAFGHTSGKYYLRNSNWPYNSYNKNVTYALFHHHGDVFLTMHDQVPTPMTVSHGSELGFDEDTFMITAEAGALVGLTVGGELIGVGEGTGVEQLIPIIPQTHEGELRIVCTKANRLRYDVNIPVTGFSGAPETASSSTSIRLSRVLPNPTAGDATIAFQVPAGADGAQVELGIYDPSGRLVRTLVNAPQSAGQHSARWDGRDQAGEQVASGVYYCKLSSAGEQDRRRMVLLR